MIVANLNKGWKYRYEDLALDHRNHAAVAAKTEQWHGTDLPCDVRQGLIRDGETSEPTEKLNCFESEWIEEKAWWFKRSFGLDKKAAEWLARDGAQRGPAYLTLDYLDFGASIYLNGVFLGEHLSVFYPFKKDVAEILKPKDNLLMVRLSAGTDRISDAEFGDFQYAVTHEKNNGRPDRGNKKRAFIRKPQYAFGWDWGPRIATVGMDSVRIDCMELLEVADLSMRTLSVGSGGAASGNAGSSASIEVFVELENNDPIATKEAVFELKLYAPQGKMVKNETRQLLLRSGSNRLTTTLDVADAQLWWPHGYGEQPLYRLQASIVERAAATAKTAPGGRKGNAAAGAASAAVPAPARKPVVKDLRVALRTLELDLSPLPELGADHRRFTFRVNGVEIFCRGANWIPADSLYQRVDEAKYRALVCEAAQANFTMLRIWGGGLYEKDAFYDACDEQGILIWQDLMFGCAFYPDRDEVFLDLVRKEIDYQARRLRSHPSLALWSGNNENHWARDTSWFKGKEPYFGGAEIYNRLAPRILETLCPHIPYWNSSPYGGAHANDAAVGDRHHWREAMMNPEMEKRITPEFYDGDLGKFVSEYGYVGPCARSTIERYFAGEKVEVGSPIWMHHNNAFEKDTVAAGIAKHYADPAKLSLDEYLVYAGQTQAMMYGYSLESMRCCPTTYGSLFWMYADCWGEVGWTIVDYYLKRKPAFYAVMRTFAPVKIALRSDGRRVHCHGFNDTAAEIGIPVRYGSIGLDGRGERSEKATLVLPARSRKEVLVFDLPKTDSQKELVFVGPEACFAGNVKPGSGSPSGSGPASKADYASGSASGDIVLPAVLRQAEFRRLAATTPKFDVSEPKEIPGGIEITIRSIQWAHGVHFDLPVDAVPSDCWFDMLPGETRRIQLRGLTPAQGRKLRIEAVKGKA